MPTYDDLKRLSSARLADARTLFRARRYDAAAYMCGYALEMALKVCVCCRLRLSEYPDKELRGAFKTHDFEDLKLLAGLREEISAVGDAALLANWSIAAKWKPEWRYLPAGTTGKGDAAAMLKALRGRRTGVLPWLKKRW